MSRSRGWQSLAKKAKGVDPAKMLSEKVADGLTLGPDAEEEAKERFPNLPGAPDLSYLLNAGGVKFRALESAELDPMYIRFPDGRLVRDVDVGFTKEDKEKIEQGYMCLRCMEPQPHQNADVHLEGCIGVGMRGPKYMRDGWHLIDVAAEFDERNVHIGPGRPIRAFLEEQEERKLKRAFAAKRGG